MAKENKYCPTTYFLSGQYDDTIVTNFLTTVYNESYARTLQLQQVLADAKEWNGTITDFSIKRDLNIKHELPIDTYSIAISAEALRISNKKEFIYKYGSLYNCKIPVIDTYVNTTLFDFAISIVIDGYRILDGVIIPLDSKTLLIVIPTDVISGKLMQTMINNNAEYSIWLEQTGTIYKYSGRLNAVLADGLEESEVSIKLPIESRITDCAFPNIDSSNSYDVYISINNKTGNRKLFAQSIAYVNDITSTYVQFAALSAFLNYITTGSAEETVYFIQRPYRVDLLLYDVNTETNPIITFFNYNDSGIYFKGYPVSKDNVIVYDYSSSTAKKFNRVNSKYTNNFAFPCIYDFEKAIPYANNGNLLIEAYTNLHSYRPFKFNNYANDFLFDTSMNDYIAAVSTKSIKAIADYNPEIPVIDGKDFFNSDYSDDIRGYLLSKLDVIMNSDAYVYNRLSTFIDNINKRTLIEYNTREEFKLNLDSVSDTSELSNKINDNIITFDTPQKVLKFKAQQEEAPSMLFINGKYTIPTLEYCDKDEMYLYIDENLVDFSLTYEESPNIIMQEEWYAKPICLDVYTKASKLSGNVQKDQFNAPDTDTIITIFEGKDMSGIRISDLIFYNALTGQIYPYTSFDFITYIEEYTLKTPEETTITILGKEGVKDYLLTIYGEAYATMDLEPILLSTDSIAVDTSDIPKDVYPNGILDICNKELDWTAINIRINDISLIGTDICVSTAPNTFMSIPLDPNEILENGDNKIEIPGITGSMDPDRYCVFIDGLLVLNEKLTFEMSEKYGGSIYITFSDDLGITETSDIRLVYTPVAYKTVSINAADYLYKSNFLSYGSSPWGFVDNYAKDFTWDGGFSIDFTSIPDIINWNTAKVYVNGARIPVDNQSHLGKLKVTNVLTFNSGRIRCIQNSLTCTNTLPNIDLRNATYTIQYPVRDKDIYDMRTDSIQNQLLDELCK